MKWIALFILALGVSCSSLRSSVGLFEDPIASSNEAMPSTYRQALENFRKQNYQAAFEGFDKFLRDEPTSTFTQVANFNAARSLQELRRYSDAAERFRAVIESTNRRAPRLQALALYQISFSYEGLGDDTKTIAALTDANVRKDFLPLSVSSAELPARMAAAYARSGNMDSAFQYYAKAEAGIGRLRAQSDKQIPDWLPQTYFHMGRLAQGELTWENLENRLRPIEKGQVYLLRAVEFEDTEWSKLGSDELKRIYDQILEVLSTPPLKNETDQVLSQREAQARQWEMTEKSLESMRRLKAARLPPETGGKQKSVDELYKYLATVEKRMQKILAQPRAGEGLTKEARERKSRVRGRVVSPDTTLEENYKKPTLPEKKTDTKGSSSQPPSDPNL